MRASSDYSSSLRYRSKTKQLEQVSLLKKGLRQIYRDSELKSFMKERSWYDHVREFCRDFRKGRKKGDVCDICLHYDHKILPQYRPLVRECRSILEAELPWYFEDFD